MTVSLALPPHHHYVFKIFFRDYAVSVYNLLEDDLATQNDNDIAIDDKLINNNDNMVSYELKWLLFFGKFYDANSNAMIDLPNGLKITLSKMNVSLSSCILH